MSRDVYKVPGVPIWINLNQVTNVEKVRDLDATRLWIFTTSEKPIKICGDLFIDDFMEAFLKPQVADDDRTRIPEQDS